MKILLVEDDVFLGAEMERFLSDAGHFVARANNARDLKNLIRSAAPDIVLLDLGLPGVDGQDALFFLRSEGNSVPIIVCSARDAENDVDRAFLSGADDYVLKPFRPAELLARISAVARRSSGAAPSRIVRANSFSFDVESGVVFFDDKELSLTPAERALMEALISRPTRIFSRVELEQKISLYGTGEGNSVEVHVCNIRKKTTKDAIKTMRGLGYRLGGAR